MLNYSLVADNVMFVLMKNILRRRLLRLLVAGCVCLAGFAATNAQSQGEQEHVWSGSAEPYMHITMKQFSTVTASDFEGRTQLPSNELMKLLEFIGSARGSIERGHMGLMVDAAYLRLGRQFSTNLAGGLFSGEGRITLSLGVYDAAFRYRFGRPEADATESGTATVVGYAGVRVIDLWADIDAEVKGPFGYEMKDKGEVERIWAQPLIGVSGSVIVAPNLRAFARADAGGFGLAGVRDFSGNAQLGLGYALCPSLQTNLSWRYRRLVWKSWDRPAYGFSNDQNGIEVGLKFLF